MRKKGAAHINKKNALFIVTTDFSLLVHCAINKDKTIETRIVLNKGKDSDIIFDREEETFLSLPSSPAPTGFETGFLM